MSDRPRDEIEVLLREAAAGRVSDEVARRYAALGRELLSDDLPRRLEGDERRRMERLLGRDLGHVRIHTGERAQRAAEALGARAFALGERDVFFGRGSFSPDTREGVGLLAHELAHTVEAAQPQGAAAGLSAERGGARGEAFAEQTEARVLAQEDAASPSPAAAQAASSDPDAPRPRWLDPDVVTEQAWRRLQELERKERERHGR